MQSCTLPILTSTSSDKFTSRDNFRVSSGVYMTRNKASSNFERITHSPLVVSGSLVVQRPSLAYSTTKQYSPIWDRPFNIALYFVLIIQLDGEGEGGPLAAAHQGPQGAAERTVPGDLISFSHFIFKFPVLLAIPIG